MRASDKRAQFVGIDAYEEAGGSVLRDLFQQDDGGWLQDPMLLDRLATEKLERDAEAVRAEGWKWVEVATDFPYGHTYGMRRITGEPVSLTGEECATREALRAEYDQLEARYAEADELPDETDQRLGEIETALAAFEERPVSYDPQEVARAGVFVSIDSSGALRVERGYVRPEDDPATTGSEPGVPIDDAENNQSVVADGADATTGADTPEGTESDGVKPLPDRLMAELTAHRTLALRQALGENPDIAFLAVLHALSLKLFYHYGTDLCLEIDAKSVVFASQAPGLNDTAAAKAIDERHRAWSEQLPEDPGKLWDAILDLDSDSRQALFAHCVGLTLNAVQEVWNRRPRALAHADRLAQAVDLDMAAAGWTATVDNYLGRVTKARVLEAVREAKGESTTQLIGHLKKGEMAEKAQELLGGTGWLPEPLRTPGGTTVRVVGNGAESLGRSDGMDTVSTGQETAAADGEERPDEATRAAELRAPAAE